MYRSRYLDKLRDKKGEAPRPTEAPRKSALQRLDVTRDWVSRGQAAAAPFTERSFLGNLSADYHSASTMASASSMGAVFCTAPSLEYMQSLRRVSRKTFG